jgi:hypothetical protein
MSGIPKTRKTMFWKLELFPSSCEERETPTLLGQRTETDLVSETLSLCCFEHWMMHKVRRKNSDSESDVYVSRPQKRRQKVVD